MPMSIAEHIADFTPQTRIRESLMRRVLRRFRRKKAYRKPDVKQTASHRLS